MFGREIVSEPVQLCRTPLIWSFGVAKVLLAAGNHLAVFHKNRVEKDLSDMFFFEILQSLD